MDKNHGLPRAGPAKLVRAESGGAALGYGDLDKHVYKILLDSVNPD
ncbi:MAG: hypothetical protein ACE5H7_08250 [Acidiferrobacterales bacterium]